MSSFLITGASSGIGAATALALDAAGHEVFAGVEAPGDGHDALAGASVRVRPVVLDVTSDASIAAAAAELDRALGGRGLDGVVNNAGIAVPAPLELLPLDDLRRTFEVNVVGHVAVTQAVLPLLRRAHARDDGTGRIVLVGSIAGQISGPLGGAYYASKHAIEAIADTLRQELDPEGLAVVLIEPSAISTPIWSKAITYLDGLVARDVPGLDRYRDRLGNFRESLAGGDEHGKDPGLVADAILKALTAGSPDTRYVVGAAGRVATALRPLLPDRLADKLGEQTA